MRYLKGIRICGCRYNERLKAKDDASTLLAYSRFVYVGERRGEGVDATLLSYTLGYINLADLVIISQVGLR